MRLWTTEHIFEHPWETVARAATRKYPNPFNPNVTGIDVLDRKVNPQTGALFTHRLITTKWSLPGIVQKILGSNPTCYGSEYSVVDPVKKTYELTSTNLTLHDYMKIDEKLVYRPHPDNKNHTILTQEAHMRVTGVPGLCGYLEGILEGNYNSNAGKGPQAMEWVITNIKKEMEDLKKAAARCESSLEQTAQTIAKNVANGETGLKFKLAS